MPRPHRAEFEHCEHASVQTDALRAVENWAGPREPDPDGGDGEYGGGSDERHRGEDHIDDALGGHARKLRTTSNTASITSPTSESVSPGLSGRLNMRRKLS